MLATGGFSRRTIPKLHVFDQIFFKNLEIVQKGTFHHKKGHFSSHKRALLVLWKNWGGGHVPPSSYAPVQVIKL
jgi:hypothetical protein